MSTRHLGVLAASAGLLLSATSVEGQSPTGLGKRMKATVGVNASSGVAALPDEWISWSADTVVDRLVYSPLKQSGLRRIDGGQLLSLKEPMVEAEERVRATLEALAVGDMGQAAARQALEMLLLEYASALQSLAGQR